LIGLKPFWPKEQITFMPFYMQYKATVCLTGICSRLLQLEYMACGCRLWRRRWL